MHPTYLLHVRRLDLDHLPADGVQIWIPFQPSGPRCVPEARAVDDDVGVVWRGVGEAGELALLELAAGIRDSLAKRAHVPGHLHHRGSEPPPAGDVNSVRVEEVVERGKLVGSELAHVRRRPVGRRGPAREVVEDQHVPHANALAPWDVFIDAPGFVKRGGAHL